MSGSVRPSFMGGERLSGKGATGRSRAAAAAAPAPGRHVTPASGVATTVGATPAFSAAREAGSASGSGDVLRASTSCASGATFDAGTARGIGTASSVDPLSTTGASLDAGTAPGSSASISSATIAAFDPGDISALNAIVTSVMDAALVVAASGTSAALRIGVMSGIDAMFDASTTPGAVRRAGTPFAVGAGYHAGVAGATDTALGSGAIRVFMNRDRSATGIDRRCVIDGLTVSRDGVGSGMPARKSESVPVSGADAAGLASTPTGRGEYKALTACARGSISNARRLCVKDRLGGPGGASSNALKSPWSSRLIASTAAPGRNGNARAA